MRNALLIYTASSLAAGAYHSWSNQHAKLNAEMDTTQQLAFTSQLIAQGILNAGKGTAIYGVGSFLLAAVFFGNLVCVTMPLETWNKNHTKITWLLSNAIGISATAATLSYGAFKFGDGAMDIGQAIMTNAYKTPKF